MQSPWFSFDFNHLFAYLALYVLSGSCSGGFKRKQGRVTIFDLDTFRRAKMEPRNFSKMWVAVDSFGCALWVFNNVGGCRKFLMCFVSFQDGRSVWQVFAVLREFSTMAVGVANFGCVL